MIETFQSFTTEAAFLLIYQNKGKGVLLNFKGNCEFCCDKYKFEKDRIHPNRQRRAMLCRTAYAKSSSQSTCKERILDVSKQRDD